MVSIVLYQVENKLLRIALKIPPCVLGAYGKPMDDDGNGRFNVEHATVFAEIHDGYLRGHYYNDVLGEILIVRNQGLTKLVPAVDANGFVIATGLHQDTGTAFGLDGLTRTGQEYDDNGFNQFGFNISGTHSNGTKFDDNGYNVKGFNVAGTHMNGTQFDADGYDMDGYDANGVFTDGSSVRNGHLSGSFQMEHTVARESYFKTVVETAQIRDAGDTKIGKFIVRNNTKDGYSLSIQTAQGGKLHPTTSDDGEADIPYGITIVKEGTVGAGIDTKYSFASNELASETDILSRAGSSVSAATNAEFELFVNIAQDQSDILGLAGTYTDTITLTYTDL